MKNLIRILIAAVTVAATMLPAASCGSKQRSAEASASGGKAIVCYFSATGTTAEAARRIAAIADADLYEIVPAEKYTAADLDWTDSLSRSSVEMRNRAYRPALRDSVTDLSDYAVVFIGYPNWWNTHPTVINTFIEANNLQGKTIVPFMTSGGSNITNSEKELREQYPALTFSKGLLMNGKTDDDIRAWLKTVQ